MKTQFSSKVKEGFAVCMPSMEPINLRSEYTVPEGTTAMVFNPANIPDIYAAIKAKNAAT